MELRIKKTFCADSDKSSTKIVYRENTSSRPIECVYVIILIVKKVLLIQLVKAVSSIIIQGYVVCREEDPQTDEPTLFLVKWFSQDKVQEWEREVSIYIKMSQTGNHPCVLPYLWHLKGEII